MRITPHFMYVQKTRYKDSEILRSLYRYMYSVSDNYKFDRNQELVILNTLSEIEFRGLSYESDEILEELTYYQLT